MRITYDSEVDALYIRFIETTVTTNHVAEGIMMQRAVLQALKYLMQSNVLAVRMYSKK